MNDSPAHLPTLCPVLRLGDAAEAIAFYIQAFGATERYRLSDPKSGRLAHAELQLGDSVLMVTQASGPALPPAASPGYEVQLSLVVQDVNAAVQSAVRARAILLRAPANHFYGYRCANLRDPFGMEWMLSQQLEALTPTEMQERWTRLSSSRSAGETLSQS